jgi:predicted acylesterase/phospholipase RssA
MNRSTRSSPPVVAFQFPRVRGNTAHNVERHIPKDGSKSTSQRRHEPYDAIVLSSGGARGIAHFGALDVLYQQHPDLIQNARYFIGSSAGAVVATLLAMGITPRDAFEGHVIPFRYKRDLRLNMLSTLFGIEASGSLEKFLSAVVDPEVTFKDIYDEYGTVLSILGTNLNTSTSVIFDAIRTPEMTVYDALRISCSVPLLFPAVRVHGDFLVDGAVSDPFPVGVAIDTYGCRNILGLRFDVFAATLDSKKPWKLDTYIGAVIDTMIHSNSIRVPARRGVVTDIVTVTTPDDISGIDFGISNERKYELFDSGAESMISYIKKHT